MITERWTLAVVEAVREALAQKRTVTFTVRGDSMAPALQDGDQVEIIPADPSQLRPGELVTYVAGNQIITHRLVRVEEAAVITRGDNRGQDDPPVPLKQVLGKARLL